MHPRARKAQQNGHKCYAAIPSLSSEDSESRPISFLVHSGSINEVTLYAYPFTRRSHSQARN